MNADTDKLVAEAVEQIDAELTKGGARLTGIDKNTFCKNWPAAKQVLQIIKLIPVAAWAASLIISVGDAFYSRKCPT